MRDWIKEFERRDAQPLVIFTQQKFQIDPLVPPDLDVPVLLDPASTISATYGLAFQLQFREGTLPWSARAATLIIDRDGVLRHADDYEDRHPLWTPLQLLDDLKEQRSLIESMKGVDARFRKAVPLVLAPVGPETRSIVPLLVEALADRRSTTRAGAAAALYWIASCADEAIPTLAKALDDEDARVRRLAGIALGRMGKAAEPHLVKALKHNDPVIRVSVAWDLSRQPALTPTALDALIAAWGDASNEVRKAAIRSLVRLPLEVRTTQPVLDALATALTDGTEPVRHDASYGLGALGSRARPAVPTIAKALHHQDKEVRRWAAITMGSLGLDAQQAVADLIKVAIHDTGNPRNRAIDALAAIWMEASSVLLALLKDGSESDRSGAATVLGRIHADDQQVVAALIEALADKSSQVRIQAAVALGEYGPKAGKAVGTLIKLLQDQDELTRMAAASSLKKIDPEAARKAGVR